MTTETKKPLPPHILALMKACDEKEAKQVKLGFTMTEYNPFGIKG